MCLLPSLRSVTLKILIFWFRMVPLRLASIPTDLQNILKIFQIFHKVFLKTYKTNNAYKNQDQLINQSEI